MYVRRYGTFNEDVTVRELQYLKNMALPVIVLAFDNAQTEFSVLAGAVSGRNALLEEEAVDDRQQSQIRRESSAASAGQRADAEIPWIAARSRPIKRLAGRRLRCHHCIRTDQTAGQTWTGAEYVRLDLL